MIPSKTSFDDAEYGSETVLLTYEECMEKIENGEIHDSGTIATLTTCHQKGLI